MPCLAKDQRGNVVTLFALALPVILGAIGAAIDYSDAVRKRSDLQLIADDAALAAAKALAGSAAATSSQKEGDAVGVAEKIIDARSAAAQRTITPSSADRSVVVSLALDKPTFFGAALAASDTTLRVSAKATYNAPPPNACLIALGEDADGGIHLVGSAKINAPQCGVWSNRVGPDSITTQGAAKIIARNVCSAGTSGSASSSPPTKSQCVAIEDPYKSRPVRCGKDLSSTACTVYKTEGSTSGKGGKGGMGVVSTYAGPCDYTNHSVTAKEKDTVSLKPGVYCGGLSIKSADVQLLPGFYQVQDGPLSIQANANVTGTGVSILLSGANAMLDLQGSPSLTLSAMTTGPYAGIAISSDTPPEPPLTSTLQGSPDITLTGSLRLPGQILKMQGSPKLIQNGLTDKTIAYGFDLQGSPDLISKANDSSETVKAALSLRLVR